jgi:hypothetical protein
MRAGRDFFTHCQRPRGARQIVDVDRTAELAEKSAGAFHVEGTVM